MQAVILAAGESSRFWPLNSTHKSLLKIMGKSIISYALESLINKGIKDIVIVQDGKRQIEKEIKNYPFSGAKIMFVNQDSPNGMGDALSKAKDLLTDNFLVVAPERVDCAEILEKVQTKIKDSKAKSVLVGSKTDTPSLFGMLKFEGNRAVGIVEKPKKGEEPSDIKVVGVYVLEPRFFDYYEKTVKHQYDFEDALSLYMKENNTEVVLMEKEGPSLKYPWHLFDVQKFLFDKYLENKIDPSAKVPKNAVIEGKVFIGKNVKVFENAVIKGPCFIGDNVTIGNSSLIRDYSNIESNSVVGAFCEVARSVFQENIHVHSGFFGDSVLAKDCKIGAGAITANVRIDRGEVSSVVKGEKKETGKTSLGCFVGEGAGVGVSSSIMPGVMIGKNSLIGPNSLVSENVEDDTVYFTKFEKIIKKKT